MFNFALIVFGVLSILSIPSECNEKLERPVVTTKSGAVQGIWKKTENGRNIEAFLSIPYAKPPTGSLRLQDPEPFGEWQGVRDGSKEPTQCLQINAFVPTKEVDGDEDCLYLNVYTPSSTGESKYPVMVFVHGGGFVGGSINSNFYGPNKLLQKDIVLVTLQYRLGFLGFGGRGDNDFPGNYGLKDQSLALKWVKNNIAKFGGNEESITLFGQSAGAASTHYHALSSQSKDVFHRAIMMSGSAFCPWAYSKPNENAELTNEMGNLVGCSKDSPSKDLLECLKKVEDASKFVFLISNFQTIWEGADPIVIFRPVLEPASNDRPFITEDEFNSESSASRPSKPTMIGGTSSEGTFVYSLMVQQKRNISETLSELNERFEDIFTVADYLKGRVDSPKKTVEALKTKYFGDETISIQTIPQLADLYSHEYFLKGIIEAIQRHKTSPFVYKLEYEGSFSFSQVISGDLKYRHGVCHGDDLLHLFPLEPLSIFHQNVTTKDKEMSNKIIDLFINFATYGNPTPDSSLMKWIPSSTGKSCIDYLSITKEGEFKMMNGFPDSKC